ncbi:putative T7SS-secreted protein [Kitasatospora sp. NPDC056138]|uniref:putative T7SS-secreted protein n=1 Tax=Kitasatospora sp. NPDC056138 TaxID=3345724 RepID=UPI0035D6EC8C
MGLGSLLNSAGNALENGFGKARADLGTVIDGSAHLAGKGLDMVGLHDVAHAVDSLGDSVADSLGAEVGEAQLGSTLDPKELVHGDVKAVDESAQHLQKFSAAFESTGQGLSRLDSDHWQGQAAEAFRSKFAPHPKQWLTAADACRAAGGALEQYARTVEWAQSQAQQAIDTYESAKQASEQARAAYNRDVDWYNQEAKAWSDYARSGNDPGPAPTAPGAFHDPGEEGVKQARELLHSARQQRDQAAESAKAAIDAVTGTAPAEPSFLSRMGSNLSDTYEGARIGQLHVAGGIVKGAADIVKFGRGLDPMDPYNLTHPAQYADHVSSTAAGLVHAANHPTELLSAVVGSGWGSDPFEAGGKLVTNLAFGAATGGGGEAAAVAERAGLGLAEDASENAARNIAESTSRDAAEDLAGNAAKDLPEPVETGPWDHLPQPSEGVESRAIHAGSVDPLEAQRFLDDQYPWMREINAPRWAEQRPGFTENCSNNVITVNHRLDGIEVSTAPLEAPRWPDPAKLGNPKAAWEDAYSYDNIIQDMKARGEGSRGVVYIGRADGTAHVFNVVNDANGVVFLDGQTGTLGNLEPGAVSIRYLPYR